MLLLECFSGRPIDFRVSLYIFFTTLLNFVRKVFTALYCTLCISAVCHWLNKLYYLSIYLSIYLSGICATKIFILSFRVTCPLTFIQRYVAIKLKVSTSFLFRENQRHGKDGRTDRQTDRRVQHLMRPLRRSRGRTPLPCDSECPRLLQWTILLCWKNCTILTVDGKVSWSDGGCQAGDGDNTRHTAVVVFSSYHKAMSPTLSGVMHHSQTSSTAQPRHVRHSQLTADVASVDQYSDVGWRVAAERDAP